MKWFTDSPDAGDPECLCSFCGERIPEDAAPIFRAMKPDTEEEIRSCRNCEWQFWRATTGEQV